MLCVLRKCTGPTGPKYTSEQNISPRLPLSIFTKGSNICFPIQEARSVLVIVCGLIVERTAYHANRYVAIDSFCTSQTAYVAHRQSVSVRAVGVFVFHKLYS